MPLLIADNFQWDCCIETAGYNWLRLPVLAHINLMPVGTKYLQNLGTINVAVIIPSTYPDVTGNGFRGNNKGNQLDF